MKPPEQWYEEIEAELTRRTKAKKRLPNSKKFFVAFIKKIQGQAVIEAAAQVADIPEAPMKILKLIIKEAKDGGRTQAQGKAG